MEPQPSSASNKNPVRETVPQSGNEPEQENSLNAETMRSNMYRLLAALTAAPPTEELLELLRRIDYDDAPDSTGQMTTAWKTMQLASEHATVESIDDEFHELFIGIGRGELVPYGSWYQTGFMMDRPLAYLRKDLAELGIERDEGVHEPEDHVGALFETMSLMTEADSGITIEKQREFFDNHLKSWIDKFFLDMQNARSARFYAAVGQLGKNFFEIEKRYLEMLA
ncbi:MAG: TorD/DmsD family molecular chaperone [Acidiferrobacterales bacterium]